MKNESEDDSDTKVGGSGERTKDVLGAVPLERRRRTDETTNKSGSSVLLHKLHI